MTSRKIAAEITVRADYRTFKQYFVYNSLRRALPWVNWALMFAIAPAYEMFLAIRFIIAGQPFSPVMWLLLGINVAGAAYLLLEPRLVYRRRAGEWESVPRTYAFEQERVVSTAGEEEEIITYNTLRRASETRSAFYLHSEDESCLALPKTCMEAEQIEALRELFAGALGEKFKGLKKK